MKYLSVLGSTGSIGCNTLAIVEQFPNRFAVKTLAAKTNTTLLAQQIVRFKPELAVVFDESRAEELQTKLPSDTKVTIDFGTKGYQRAAAYPPSEMVVTAMVGAAGLLPTLAAIDAGKTVALANKETLVMAGEIVMQRAADRQVAILPIDSEHSAIFQCLHGHNRDDLHKVILTASGGPLLHTPRERFDCITPQEALKHPNWSMGRKISIDSATLMNKGLELIEATHLFNVSFKDIEVVVHPQSIIHSMVAYRDGSVLAQLSIPDMKGAIAYAISFPERLELAQPLPAFADIGAFTFEKPDLDKFNCLALAVEACQAGGTMPAVLNAANEVAVHAYLENRISFNAIAATISNTMQAHTLVTNPSLSDIMKADHAAREEALALIDTFVNESR